MTRRIALVFDVDGVLVRGRPDDGAPWFRNLREDLNIDPGALTRDFFCGPFADALRGRADMRVLLEELLGSPGSAEQLIDYWFRNDSRLNLALLEFVARIKSRPGLKTFLATNQEHHRAAYLWDTLRLKERFDKMVYSADVGVCKPERKFFEAAEVRLDLAQFDRMLFVDDQRENVDAAREHGWNATQFHSTQDLIEALHGQLDV